MRVPKGITLRITLLGWVVPLVTLLGLAVAQQAKSGGAISGEARGLRHTRLYEIASSRLFARDVNRDDARAGLKVMFDVMARQRGFVLDSSLDILDSVAEIRERLQSHSADLILLAATDYLELENSRLVTPVLTAAWGAQGSALYSYLLLVKAPSPATAIAGLRGKNMLAFSRGGTDTALAWIDLMLDREKLGRAASFFASIKAAGKPQACILPLFFGAVDACVVDEADLNLAQEMNPQLGHLRVLARSRPLIGSIVAMPTVPFPYAKELIDAMLSLHQDPLGRQLLMIFKSDRLVRIQPGDLDAARELWRDYYRLPGASPGRPAGFGTAAAESNPADRGKERK